MEIKNTLNYKTNVSNAGYPCDPKAMGKVESKMEKKVLGKLVTVTVMPVKKEINKYTLQIFKENLESIGVFFAVQSAQMRYDKEQVCLDCNFTEQDIDAINQIFIKSKLGVEIPTQLFGGIK